MTDTCLVSEIKDTLVSQTQENPEENQEEGEGGLASVDTKTSQSIKLLY